MSHNQDPTLYQPQIDPARFAALREHVLPVLAAAALAFTATVENASATPNERMVNERPQAPMVDKPKPGEKPADGKQTLECRQIEVKIPDVPTRNEKPDDAEQRIVKGKTVAGGITSLIANFGKRTTGSTKTEKSKPRVNKSVSSTRQNCDSDPDRPSLG